MYRILAFCHFVTLIFVNVYSGETDLPYLHVSNPASTFVAIVANEDYQDFTEEYTSNVLHAVYDAERFKQYLIKRHQVPPENISFYANGTAAHIKLYLSKLGRLSERSANTTEIIFYYSGKVLTDQNGQITALLPVDVSSDQPYGMIKPQEIYEKLERTTAGRVTVLFDAVPEGKTRASSLLDGGGKPVDTNLLKDYPKVSAWYSFPRALESTDQIAEPDVVRDIEPPVIHINHPADDNSRQVSFMQRDIIIRGSVEDETGISIVAVNGEEAHIRGEGSFMARIFLEPGENAVTVSAIDQAGNRSDSRFTITRNPFEESRDLVPVPGPLQYYALIIGIDEYDDAAFMDLDNPVRDARDLYNILKERYGFREENMLLLRNPDREVIIRALDKFENTLNENDNLLIFYAGHGNWDERTQKGYWIPSDAGFDNTAKWIRNSTISGYISGISTKHTLLIADACFSGGIFKTRAIAEETSGGIQRLNDLPSRKAMTSGTLKEVPDKSVFMYYLLKRLGDNDKKFMPVEELFHSFKPAVLSNSDNIPQFGVIKNSGDEGGDFIFIKQ